MKNGALTTSALDAKDSLTALLEQVERGAAITIAKLDRPVARLVPASVLTLRKHDKAAAGLRAMSERYSLKGCFPVRELKGAGRS